MTSPVAEPVQGPEAEPRAMERRAPTSGDIPFPRFPSRKPSELDVFQLLRAFLTIVVV